MGVIGGGVLTSSLLQWQRSAVDEKIVSQYQSDDEEDSWSGFFRSSIESIKRSVKKEVS